jgi:hypothetical protein
MNKTIRTILFILAVLVVAFILFLGYKNLVSFSPHSSRNIVSIEYFEEEAVSHITSISNDYGSMRIHNLKLNSNYHEVCFTNKRVVAKGTDVSDHVIDLDVLKVDNDFCLEPVDGIIKIKVEGFGNSTLVSSAQ